MGLALTRLGKRVTIALKEAIKGDLSKLDDFLDFVDAIKKMEVTSDTVDTIEERFDVGAAHLVITDDMYKKLDNDFDTLQEMNDSLDTTQWN